jgi:HSP20 family protein
MKAPFATCEMSWNRTLGYDRRNTMSTKREREMQRRERFEPSAGNGGRLASYPTRPPAPSQGGFDSFHRLRGEIARLFDQYLGGWWPTTQELAPEWRWNLDIEETDEAIMIRAEAPGFEPEDFNLHVQGHLLILHAVKSSETRSRERGYREWRRQEFHRSVPLPADVNVDEVDALYHNGILTVTLPKTEQEKGRRIEVKTLPEEKGARHGDQE